MTTRTHPPGLVAFRLAPLLLLLASCASPGASEPPDLGRAAVGWASAVKSGAGAVGRGVATAYRGVRSGFEEPDADARFGPYPRDYVETIRKHLIRALHYPEDAGFVFGRPERGYLNRGLFQGGGVAWQGWLVDAQVTTTQRLTGHQTTRRYVVRLRDGEIVDVHTDDALLRRVADDARRARSAGPRAR